MGECKNCEADGDGDGAGISISKLWHRETEGPKATATCRDASGFV